MKMSTAKTLAQWLCPAGMALLTSCGTIQPRITEVSHRKYVVNIPPEDQRLFTRDRASQFQTEIRAIPAVKQREEFVVRWAAYRAAVVKLEYRQVSRPGELRQQTQTIRGQHTAKFVVGGQEFAEGGIISAWRASLWDESGTVVAEMKSALW